MFGRQIPRATVGIVITLLDVVCLLLFIVGINVLIRISKLAIEEYKENTL